MLKYVFMNTPLGRMLAAEYEGQLCLLEFDNGKKAMEYLAELANRLKCNAVEENSPILHEVERQLKGYFQGDRREFEIPLLLIGSDFQKSVWSALQSIPRGQTTDYGSMASRIGKPQAVRAVGRANASNPIAIIVPCHRVIGKDGSLVGYGGELWRKKWLLEHEGALTPSVLS